MKYRTRTEEMAQLVRCLLRIWESDFNPQYPQGKLGIARKVVTGGSLEFTGQPVSLKR